MNVSPGIKAMVGGGTGGGLLEEAPFTRKERRIVSSLPCLVADLRLQ